MLADRQTTGGYPKIATVCSVDLSLIGQAKPGDTVRFATIGRRRPYSSCRTGKQPSKKWKDSLPRARPQLELQISIAGQRFSTYVEEIR